MISINVSRTVACNSTYNVFRMKHLGIIVCVIFFLGCRQNRIAMPFPEDRTISDEYGVPEDSMSAYFPEVLFNDTTTYL